MSPALWDMTRHVPEASEDDASSPTAFHKQCDMYNTTMVVVRNSLGFTFGGYVRVPYRVFVVFHQLLLAYSTR